MTLESWLDLLRRYGDVTLRQISDKWEISVAIELNAGGMVFISSGYCVDPCVACHEAHDKLEDLARRLNGESDD